MIASRHPEDQASALGNDSHLLAGNDRLAGERAHARRKPRAVELVLRVADNDVTLADSGEDELVSVANTASLTNLDREALDLVERY